MLKIWSALFLSKKVVANSPFHRPKENQEKETITAPEAAQVAR